MARERTRIKPRTASVASRFSLGFPNQKLCDSWAVSLRIGLRDDQWNRIKDILPGREGHVGGTAEDNRLFVEAVLYRYRTGCPWRDLPARFGHWKSVHQRLSRWAQSGVFERIFKMLASDHDNEYMMIDATIVRAHQHSAGARKKTARKRLADHAED
jgi:transposase